jgi:MFS family permease
MLLWCGQIVSVVGSNVSQIALPLLILAMTGSPAKAGLAGALYFVPYIILSLPAGALVERWNRKQVMIVCDICRAVALGSIPTAFALGHLTLIQLYVVAAVEGSLYVFFNIAEVACLPRVVAREQLPAATSQNQAGFISATLAGPPLGGFIYQTLGRTVPFLIDAISYVASVVSLFFIRTEFQEGRTAERRELRTEILEGLAWLWRHPLIRYMAFLTGGLNFASSGTLLILIVLAKHQGASPTVIGVMLAIGSVGGIAGSLLGAPIQRRFSFAQVIIVTVWIQALFFPLFAVAPNPAVLGLIDAAIFVNGPIYNVVQMGYRLALIPDELQGRVNSVFRLLAFGFQPLGLLLSGFLLQDVGAVSTVLLFSAVMIVLALVTTLNGHVRHARLAPKERVR